MDHLFLPSESNIERERRLLIGLGESELEVWANKWPNHAPGIAANQELSERRELLERRRWLIGLLISALSLLVAIVSLFLIL
jgi:hypothetical protein